MNAPGFYPDPTGKPGQVYWDGQKWVPSRGSPQNSVTASLRRRWTSLRTRTKIAVVAAMVAIPVFTVWMTGSAGASDSYKAGYASGTNGSAQNHASLMFGVGETDHRADCRSAYTDATANQVHSWNVDDFTEGCMQALQDHPPTSNPVLHTYPEKCTPGPADPMCIEKP
jgi:hypothetical protein